MASYTLSPIGGAGSQFFDNSGNVLSGGKLYTYRAGTTTPTPTYTNPAGTTANSNPVVFNSAGRPVNEIWLSAEYVYKFVLKDANDVLIATYDNIPGLPQPPIVNDASSISYEPNIIVSAGSFVVGQTYMIASLGNTDFTLIGAVYNSTGVIFTATGAGSGTGTAYVSTTVETRLRAYEASGGSNYIGFLQAGTGVVSRTTQSKLRDIINVKDFGAVGDGVTDDTDAIQAAANYCTTNGFQLVGAPGTYKTSATITLNCSGDLSEMTINCPAATVSPAILVGTTTGSPTSRIILTLPKVTNTSKTTTGWVGFENSVGVDVGNLNYSQITIPRVYGFGINLYVGGYTVGNQFNQYFILQLADAKVNCKIGGKSANAWSNENNYYCGNFVRSSSEGTLPITGAYSIWFDGITGRFPNNNVFYKPTVENDNDQYQFNFENAQLNLIIAPRFEVTGGGRVRFYSSVSGDTSDNSFIGGYLSAAPHFTFDGAVSRQNKYYASRHGDSLEFTGNGIQLVNNSGSEITEPHIQGFAAGSRALSGTAASTNWTYRLFSGGLYFKQSTDNFARIQIDGYNNRILLGNGVAAPVCGIYALTNNLALKTPTGAIVRPDFDNTVSLGSADYRWSQVFAGTGTINTSDENEKTDIRPLDYKEKAVALAIKARIKAFKFKDAVEQKGNDARIHFGVIAQDVKAAFKAEGLDATKYGVFCSDKLKDGTERLGVRYDELLAFILAVS